MAVIHISEAEAARDLPALLARAANGDEVQIDSGNESFRLTKFDSRATGILQARYTQPRPISDILADLERRGSEARLDPGYTKHLEDVIRAGQEETWIEL